MGLDYCVWHITLIHDIYKHIVRLNTTGTGNFKIENRIKVHSGNKQILLFTSLLNTQLPVFQKHGYKQINDHRNKPERRFYKI